MDKSNKILIVDDSEINRSLLADMLSADYSLLEASNAVSYTHLDVYKRQDMRKALRFVRN